MKAPYPDAQSWAHDHSLANVPRLARLEGFAFQCYPQIVAAFGSDGAAMARFAASRHSSPARRVRDLLMIVVLIIVGVAPVAGVAIYGVSPALPTPTAGPIASSIAIPFAGICFMISAATQLVCWVVWLRGGARWSPMLLGIALVAMVMALFASIGLPTGAARDGYADLGTWIWPVWLTLALSIPLAAGILLRRRFTHPGPVDEPLPLPPTASDRERARLLVTQVLSADQREAVQADRDAALSILADRGLLDVATLERALAADLGTLFTLDPIAPEGT